MSTEPSNELGITEEQAKKEITNYNLFWNIRRYTNRLEELEDKKKLLEEEISETLKELNLNKEVLLERYKDETHYFKFEYNTIVVVFPNRIKIIELE